MNSNFDWDFQDGFVGEQLVFDLLTGGRRVEVKTDRKWIETGNVYIETSCWSNKTNAFEPSGLITTEADYWAFVLEGLVLMVHTVDLRMAAVTFGKPVSCNIDPNPSKGFLIQIPHLLFTVKKRARGLDYE